MTREEAVKIIKSATDYTPKETEALETLIPELRESEDERIRKEMIKAISKIEPGKTYIRLSQEEKEAWIAYLEKQKEPVPIPDKFSGLKSLMLQYLQSAANRKDDTEIESDTDLWGRKILDYVWKQDEKQKEQKPVEGDNETEIQKAFREGKSAGRKEVFDHPEEYGLQKEHKPAEWSFPYGKDETVDKLIAIAGCLEMDGDCLFNGYTGTECGKFLRDLARKQVECKPVEWSDNFEEAVADLIEKAKQGKCDSLSPIEEGNKLLAIAKHGKVNQQKWSEEDEEIYGGIISVLEKSLNANRCYFTSDDVDRLKSLRPRLTKSDEK